MMFRFTIELPENWDDKQTLPNSPVEGVALNSPLGIVISCLQANCAQSIVIAKSKPFYEELNHQQFSDQYKKFREERSSSLRKDFFLKNNESLASRKRVILVDKQLSKNEFQILCYLLKGATSLQNLLLHTERLPFTQEEEQELIAAIRENTSVQSVTMIGGTKEMATAIQAIERPSLELFESGLLSRHVWKLRCDEEYRAQVLQQDIDERNSNNAQATVNMHILQGFVAVVGATAVATAFVMLSAATLNPVGVTLAASGTVALAWSAHSFFSYSPKEPEAPGLAEEMFLQDIIWR